MRAIIPIKSTAMTTYNENELAEELAEALHDTDSLMLYHSFVNLYSEKLLRDTLKKVLAIPNEKIKKTRGALFNYLIQQHAHKQKNYPRS